MYMLCLGKGCHTTGRWRIVTEMLALHVSSVYCKVHHTACEMNVCMVYALLLCSAHLMLFTVMNRTPNPFPRRHANLKTTFKCRVTPRSDIVNTRCVDIPNSHHVSRTAPRVHLLWSLTTRRMYQHWL
jgi:hypothetical protein